MKLISNPKECGFRKLQFTRLGIPCGVLCKHREAKDWCSTTGKEFPNECPLQNGYTKEQLKDIVEYEKRNVKAKSISKTLTTKDFEEIDRANDEKVQT